MRRFEEYLRRQGNVYHRRIPYYIKWVKMYLDFAAQKTRDQNTTGSIRSFCETLGLRYEEWQVLQARDAVCRYIYYLEQETSKSHKSPGPGREVVTFDRLAEQYRRIIRLKQLSYQTEKTYLQWLRRFCEYLNGRSPTAEILRLFLSYLAVDRRVSAATQKQAFNALLFLFRHVLFVEVQGLNDVVPSPKRRRLPVVLTKNEVSDILGHLRGDYLLMAKMLYGAGLRLSECLSLRIKDIDFERGIIVVRSGKGDKDRHTVLPAGIVDDLREQMARAHSYHTKDRSNAVAGVMLPKALERKYPNAGEEWGWFWLFPARRLSVDPMSHVVRRFHIFPSSLQKAFRAAVRASDVTKHATVHTLRHSFATDLVEHGYDIRTVQELLGHSNVSTTMIYTHVATRNKLGVVSPMDRLI